MSGNLKRKLSVENVPSKKKNRRKKGNQESLEKKISNLLNAVRAQGPLGNLVILLQDEHPYSTLQNSLNLIPLSLAVTRSDVERDNFSLAINNEEFVSGTFQNFTTARRELAEKALEKLKDICFCITTKDDYFNVTKENLHTPTSDGSNVSQDTPTNGGSNVSQHTPTNGGSDVSQNTPISGGSNVCQMTNMNSIAHKMMMRMGWTGGGLGAQEQGIVNSVTLSENVNRSGFGHHGITKKQNKQDIMKQVTKKLKEFSKSPDSLTLVFNDDFTSDERKAIHRIAARFNLKSKSTGSVSRKLAVSRKLTRMDIVQELLKIGGEDGLYKLHIPRNYEHIWH